jgi:hypothetical protein
MISFLSFLARTVLLAIFVFGFVVLLEHGTSNFPAGASQEFSAFQEFVAGLLKKESPAGPVPAGS